VTTSETRSADTLPARVTTPLLVLITQQSMDEDYEHVAEQRRSGARPVDARAGRSPRTMVAVLLFGALLAVAAVQTARNAHVDSAGREELISRIDARRDGLADLQDQKARLSSDNAAAQATYDAAGRQLNTLDQDLTDVSVPTGFETMSGPGVRIVVDDAPGGDEAGQVQDKDLALLVNGLWQAGARGVSVNGQRVTALSSLRNTAQSIRINGISLSPPYTVLAVGDNRTLQADLAESTSGTEFTALTSQYGMPVTMENRDEVRLPAAPAGMMTLHHARSGTSKQQKPKVNEEDTE
jgi:uncharacterized protein YlxW (UPF0749 family)